MKQIIGEGLERCCIYIYWIVTANRGATLSMRHLEGRNEGIYEHYATRKGIGEVIIAYNNVY